MWHLIARIIQNDSFFKVVIYNFWTDFLKKDRFRCIFKKCNVIVEIKSFTNKKGKKIEAHLMSIFITIKFVIGNTFS